MLANRPPSRSETRRTRTKGEASAENGPGPENHHADADEIGRFDTIAEEWWDPNGKFRPLHAMNPVRAAYIRDRLTGPGSDTERPLSGWRVLDVGCGGGLLSETLAHWGARVVGIDAGEKAIAVAQQHAAQSGLAIDYRCMTAEALLGTEPAFDAVTALEVVEHVPDPASFCATLAALTRPGGHVIMSTLNRTPASFLTAIVAAEYVLGWLPRGTHNWNRFVKPSELATALRRAGMIVEDTIGMRPSDPAGGRWHLTRASLAVNYLISAKRP